MNIKIIAAVHKPHHMPSVGIYLPIHVRHAGNADICF